MKITIRLFTVLQKYLPPDARGRATVAVQDGATVQQAQAAWMSELNRRLEAVTAKARKPGVEPVGSKGGPSAETGDPIVAYNVAVANKVKAGMKQHEAVLAVNREQPELRAAYVAAYNAAKGRR